jgi:hypothetical protein
VAPQLKRDVRFTIDIKQINEASRRGHNGMKDEDEKKLKFIRKRSFKNLKVIHAPTTGVDSMIHVSEYFMKEIFDFDQGDYFITDEARLLDFTDFGSGDITPFIKKIKKVYGIDVSDVHQGNLLEIFRRIDKDMNDRQRKIGKTSTTGTIIAFRKTNKKK